MGTERKRETAGGEESTLAGACPGERSNTGRICPHCLIWFDLILFLDFCFVLVFLSFCFATLTLYYWTFQVTTMSLVIPYIINMYRFGVLDQLGQLIILIYHICIFGVRDLLEINVVQSKIINTRNKSTLHSFIRKDMKKSPFFSLPWHGIY